MATVAITGAINPSWAKKLVTNGNGGEMMGVTEDSDGNIYVCGNYLAANSFTFEGVTLPAGNSATLRVGFYAKFNSTGTLQWIKTIKSANSYVRFGKIKVDATHMYVVGEYVSTSAIALDNSQSLPISVGIDGFMVSVSKADGTAQWTARIGGGNNDIQTNLTLDSDNVYFTGSYSQAITFNASVSLPGPSGTFDGCIIAYRKSDGTALWAKRIPGTGGEIAYGVVHYESHLYISSFYYASTNVTLQASPEIILPAIAIGSNSMRGSAPLLLKMKKSDGEFVWARYFATDRDLSFAYTVAADSTGVYFGGNYCLTNTFDLGNGVILPASLSNVTNANTAFIIKYDHSGVAQWVRTINTTVGYNNVISLMTADGYIYIGGAYLSTAGPTSFNSFVSLPQNSSRSAFLFCCTTDGYPFWTDVLVNSFNTAVFDIAKTSTGIGVGYSHAGFGATIGNGVTPPGTGMVASPMVVKYLVQNPLVTPANVETVLTKLVTTTTNATAAADVKTFTTTMASSGAVQKIIDTSKVAIFGKATSVQTINLTSTDGSVSIKTYNPISVSTNSVAIAVKNSTDSADISSIVPGASTLPQLVTVAVNKYDTGGNKVIATIADTTTYDTLVFDLSIANSARFGFIHTDASGVKTLLTANVDIANATIDQAIVLSGAAGATLTVKSRGGNIATIEYFGPFSSIDGIGLGDGDGNLVQNGNSVVYDTGAVPCFVPGTMILTPKGYRAVETLSVGDYVTTADGRNVVATVYMRKVESATAKSAPYRIPAHTFGKKQINEITLSPLHAIQIRKGVWEIPQEAAKRYHQIKQVGLGKPVTYFHIETPNYFRDNLVANGAVVESFGINQIKNIPRNVNVYEFSARLGGYTRYSPSSASISKAC